MPVEAREARGQRLGELTYFRAEQAITPRTRPRLTPRTLGILWDASGSGHARDLARELDLVARYLRSLPDGAKGQCVERDKGRIEITRQAAPVGTTPITLTLVDTTND